MTVFEMEVTVASGIYEKFQQSTFNGTVFLMKMSKKEYVFKFSVLIQSLFFVKIGLQR